MFVFQTFYQQRIGGAACKCFIKRELFLTLTLIIG